MDAFEKMVAEAGVRGEFRFGEATKPYPSDRWSPPHNWRVTLRLQRRQLTVDFYGGAMVENPTAADVLRSLCLDACCGSMPYEEFCEELGYEPSSEAKRIHRHCEKMAPRLQRFLGDLYEVFMEAL